MKSAGPFASEFAVQGYLETLAQRFVTRDHFAEALFQLLRDLALMENRAILVVEHNVRLIFGYTDEVTVMNLGQVIANGAPDEISRNMAVKEAYLGVR